MSGLLPEPRATYKAAGEDAQGDKAVHLEQQTPLWVQEAVDAIPDEPPSCNGDEESLNEVVLCVQITLQAWITVEQRVHGSDTRVQAVHGA